MGCSPPAPSPFYPVPHPQSPLPSCTLPQPPCTLLLPFCTSPASRIPLPPCTLPSSLILPLLLCTLPLLLTPSPTLAPSPSPLCTPKESHMRSVWLEHSVVLRNPKHCGLCSACQGEQGVLSQARLKQARWKKPY